MLPISSLNPSAVGAVAATNEDAAAQAAEASEESKLQFEKLLWAELLTHTGLEDALTLGGGQGASMFARYFVEAIAADIAEQHPLGLLDSELPTQPNKATELGGAENE